MLRFSFSEWTVCWGPESHGHTQRVKRLLYTALSAASTNTRRARKIFGASCLFKSFHNIYYHRQKFVMQAYLQCWPAWSSRALTGEILHCLRACNPATLFEISFLNGLDPFWRPSCGFPNCLYRIVIHYFTRTVDREVGNLANMFFAIRCNKLCSPLWWG